MPLLTFAGFSLFSNHALAANILAKIAGTYTSHSTTDGGSSTATSRMIYDIGVYYKFQGAGGWMTPRDSGVYLLATYFVSSKYGDFTDGNGYQADLGYKFTPKASASSFMS